MVLFLFSVASIWVCKILVWLWESKLHENLYLERSHSLIPSPSFLISPVDIQPICFLASSFLYRRKNFSNILKINRCTSIFLYLLSCTKDAYYGLLTIFILLLSLSNISWKSLHINLRDLSFKLPKILHVLLLFKQSPIDEHLFCFQYLYQFTFQGFPGG